MRSRAPPRRSGKVPDPSFRRLELAGGETPDLGGDEVRRQAFGEARQRRVRHETDFPDLLVVITHEAEMARHRGEILPAGKFGGLDDDARDRPIAQPSGGSLQEG